MLSLDLIAEAPQRVVSALFPTLELQLLALRLADIEIPVQPASHRKDHREVHQPDLKYPTKGKCLRSLKRRIKERPKRDCEGQHQYPFAERQPVSGHPAQQEGRARRPLEDGWVPKRQIRVIVPLFAHVLHRCVVRHVSFPLSRWFSHPVLSPAGIGLGGLTP